MEDYKKSGVDLLDTYNLLQIAKKTTIKMREQFLVNTNETTTLAYNAASKQENDAQIKYDNAVRISEKEKGEALSAIGNLNTVFSTLNDDLKNANELIDAAKTSYDVALKEAKLGSISESKSDAERKQMWRYVAECASIVSDKENDLANLKADAVAKFSQSVVDAAVAAYQNDPTTKQGNIEAIIATKMDCDRIYEDALSAKINAAAAFSELTKIPYSAITDDNSTTVSKLNDTVAQMKKDQDAAIAKAKADADAAVAKAKADADAAVAKTKTDADATIAANKKKTDAAIAAAQASIPPVPVTEPTFFDSVLKIIGLK
jgi:hypothetical protein